ncbi:MAG TPA: ABC transporter permease, partial [Solirubrobacterales bacterium]|nr:ABC transporter permease [Solirubrobacterales bacterium]
MSGFAGTADAIRFALKRDRLILPIWVAVLIGWIAMEVISYKNLYGTTAQLDALYRSVAGNPAMVAISGPTGGIRTLGGAITWDSLPTISVVSGVFAMFSVVRHTRAEEEDGRTELLLAYGSGRLAPLAAALTVTLAALALASAGYVAVFAAEGLPVGPATLLSLSFFGFGAVIAGTTAVVCQVTSKARAARGLVGIVIGAAWLLRAIGDTGGGTLTWFSPLGWAEQTRPFWEDRWWPLLLPLAAFAVTLALSGWLLVRRDIGGGLIQPRPGPARAHKSLLHPLGFAFRIQRGSIIGWAVMLFAYGFAVGVIGDNIEQLLKTSSAFTEAFASASGNLLDSYFASILTVIA